MSHSWLPQDPQGYYARLGVPPDCRSEAITLAYRRAARIVHPDVPGTGDAAAFLALKQAYDVLRREETRSVYDRARLVASPPKRPGRPVREEGGDDSADDRFDYASWEIDPPPRPPMAAAAARHPRWRDLPLTVWIGIAAVLLVGGVEVGWRLAAAPGTAARPEKLGAIPATARDVPPPSLTDPAPATFGSAPVRLAGVPTYYVLPAAVPATLWRADPARHGLVPWGQLPPFSAVQGLRIEPRNGMVEVKVTDSINGFIESGRLTPGSAAAAARAWCTFHAGMSPENGELLTRSGEGGGSVAIENRSPQPAVVKLRAEDGTVAASVFLAPGGQTVAAGLREHSVRVEYATGEVWSRACHGFSAGQRARVLAEPVLVGAARRIAVPPETGPEPAELADPAFERE